MAVDKQMLDSLEVFQELEPHEMEMIAELTSLMNVTEGEVIMKRGDRAHTFFIILKGNFMVHFKQGRALTLHNKGDIMGWSTVIPPFYYKGNGVALTEGEVLAISSQDLDRLIQGDSALGNKIMHHIEKIAEERKPFVLDELEEGELQDELEDESHDQ